MIKIQYYSFVIKKAAAEDAEIIIEIIREAFEKYKIDAGINTEIDALNESVEDVKLDILKKNVFIAYVDEKPVGTIRVEILPDNTALITRFGVKTKYSNNGVGKSLIGVVDQLLISKGVKKVGLYTASKHASLVSFYYARGFYVDFTVKDKGYTRAFMIKEYN